jgi:hypothetical protein
MSEGIEWMLELDGKTAGLDNLLKQLDMGIDRIPKADAGLRALSGSMDRSSAAAGAAGAAHGRHAKGAEESKHALERLVHSGMDPFIERAKSIAEFTFLQRSVESVLEAPGEMIEKVKELGAEMLKAAAHGERMDHAFKLLFGKHGADKEDEYIKRIHKTSQFSKDALEAADLSLARVGFKDPLSRHRALAAAEDMSSFSANKEEGFSSALETLERIQRTSDVSERALGGLGFGKKDFLKELSTRTGLGIETLKKQLESGKVKAETSLEALYSMIHKKTGKALGAAGVEASSLLDSRLGRLQELPDLFSEKLKGTEGYSKVSAFTDRLFKSLDPDSAGGEKIFATLDKSFMQFVSVLDGIDLEKDLKIGIEIFEKLPRLIDLTTKALELFAVAAGAAVGPLVPVLGAMALTNKADRAEMKGMANQAILGKSTEDLDKMNFFERFGVGVKGGVKALGGMLSAPFRSAGEDAGAGLTVGGDFKKAGEVAGGNIIDGARGPKGIDAHSPSKKFQHLGEMAAEGFGIGFDVDDAFVVPSTDVRSAVPGTGGNVQVSMPAITVHVHGAGSEADARAQGEAAGEGFAEIARAELVRFFEGLKKERGA